MKKEIFRFLKMFIIFNMLGHSLNSALDTVEVAVKTRKGNVKKEDVYFEYVWISVFKKFRRLVKEV